MKTLLLVLFIPFILFGQIETEPDSIYLKTGKSAKCLVSRVEKSSAHLIYKGDRVKIMLEGVEKLIVENRGTVYQSGPGITADQDLLNSFLKERYIRIRGAIDSAENAKKNQAAAAAFEEADDTLPEAECNKVNRWSFGVLYIPYYTGTSFQITHYYSDIENRPQLYQQSFTTSMMETQYSYKITPALRVIFDIGYTATLMKDENSNHTRESYSGGGSYSSDNGADYTDNLKTFVFSIGAKYYLTTLFENKAAAYVIAGAGKQIAWSTNEYKYPYRTQTTTIYDDNLSDFLSDINSPYIMYAGFGAEYFFNQSLSLNANMRVYYTSACGELESTTITKNMGYERTYTTKNKFDRTNVVTRIGLGVNLYF